MAARLEAGQPPRLRLVGVDREGVVAAPAGMRDMVDAAADRAARPAVVDVEDQRRVDRQRRVQARRRLPGLEADAGDGNLAVVGQPSSARRGRCKHGVALRVEAFGLDLQPLDRAIDEAHRAADRTLLAHDVPWLQRLAQLKFDAGMIDLAAEGEAELELRVEPFRPERRSRAGLRSSSTSMKSAQT